jgi:hypothetical protein
MSWFSSSERRKKLATGGFYSIQFGRTLAARLVRGFSESRRCARRAYLKIFAPALCLSKTFVFENRKRDSKISRKMG